MMTKSVSKTKVLLSKIALLPSLLVFFICAESSAKINNTANRFATPNKDLQKHIPSQKNEYNTTKRPEIRMHYLYSRKIKVNQTAIQGLMDNLGAYVANIYKTPEGVKRENEFAKFTFLLDNDGNISEIKIFEEEGNETEATLLRILQSRPKVASEKKSGEANWDPITVEMDFWPKNLEDSNDQDKPIFVMQGVFGLPGTSPSEFVDIVPKYIGNRDKLNKDIADTNLGRKDFPKGKLRIGFVVETDGSLSNFTLISEIKQEAFNEVVKILKDTKWEPGVKDGKVVKTSYELKVPISALN